MEGFRLIFNWHFNVDSSAEELWPFVSNVNLLFKEIGLPAVKQTKISRQTPKDHLELTHAGLISYEVWDEKPYHWEFPNRFGTTRNYRIGILQSIKFQVDLTTYDYGTKIRVKINGNARNNISKQIAAFYMNNILRRKLRKTLQHFDTCIQNEVQPYELSRVKRLPKGAKQRVLELKDELIKITRRPRAVRKLTDLLLRAEDWQLERIHPYDLAEIWGENKYAVLNVFLHAAKLELLDFGWDISCSNCRSVQQHIHKLSELRTSIYCDACEDEHEVDFNNDVHLVFRPNPLIRKYSDKKFSISGPQNKPDLFIQQYLNIGDVKYLKVLLDYGTYIIKQADGEGVIKLRVEDEGEDNLNIIFTEDPLDDTEVVVSRMPNLTFTNKTRNTVLTTLEKENWGSKMINTAEIVAQHDFKSLFSDEIIKEGLKFKAKGLTILFTDLMDSTSIYEEHGEEMAIGQVMSHFKIIQQIVAEERGSIVKTIGDSVMAVFKSPVNSIKAVERIQNILSTSTSLGESFKLKAGIHIGDCTAVNLNNRIDYFGTTVNIAARLVDFAAEREIVVSQDIYNHPEVRTFLSQNNEKLFVKDSQATLKGFNDDEFTLKHIRLEKTKLRLVI